MLQSAWLGLLSMPHLALCWGRLMLWQQPTGAAHFQTEHMMRRGPCPPVWTSFARQDRKTQPFFTCKFKSQNPNSETAHLQVYEFASLLEGGGGGGAHYPVLDLPFRAKLAAVTWNTYLKSHLLAADYAGIATLVDASVGVEVS